MLLKWTKLKNVEKLTLQQLSKVLAKNNFKISADALGKCEW